MTGTIETPFNCEFCGPTPARFDPNGDIVSRFCSGCGNTWETFAGTPEERLDAAERGFRLAYDDLVNDRFDNPPSFYDTLSDDDKRQTRATLRLGRYDNALYELNEARKAMGLPFLSRLDIDKEYRSEES